MASADRQLLDSLREDKVNIVELTILSLLCGISLPLFIRAIVKLRRRGLSTRSSQLILAVCVINMTLLVLTFGVTVAMTLYTLGRSTLAAHPFLILTTIQLLTIQLVPLISDMIVIWRAAALYTDKRWLLIVPCGFFLGAIGVSILNIIAIARRMAILLPLGDSMISALDPDTTPNPNSLFFFLPCSMAANAGATFCIWFKLWSYRKQLKSFGLQTKQSLADQVLVLLVESGVFYCALQLVNVFVTYFQGGLSMASSIVFPVYFVFSAMYPSLVVVFVDKKTSVVEIFITSMAQETAGLDSGSHERRAATFGHLSFASVGSQKTTDSSEFMHHLGNEETLTTDPLLPRHISVCDSNV